MWGRKIGHPHDRPQRRSRHERMPSTSSQKDMGAKSFKSQGAQREAFVSKQHATKGKTAHVRHRTSGMPCLQHRTSLCCVLFLLVVSLAGVRLVVWAIPPCQRSSGARPLSHSRSPDLWVSTCAPLFAARGMQQACAIVPHHPGPLLCPGALRQLNWPRAVLRFASRARFERRTP